MKRFLPAGLIAAVLAGIAAPAFAVSQGHAQEDAQANEARTQTAAPSAEESAVVVNWGNLQNAIAVMIRSDQQKSAMLAKVQADAAALADYWSNYVAGLKK